MSSRNEGTGHMTSNDFGATDFFGINVLGHFKDMSLASKCPLNFARGWDRPFPTKALENKQLKILSVRDKRQKKQCKKYRTHLYGFDFGEVPKKQGQDMLSSMKTHCIGVLC